MAKRELSPHPCMPSPSHLRGWNTIHQHVQKQEKKKKKEAAAAAFGTLCIYVWYNFMLHSLVHVVLGDSFGPSLALYIRKIPIYPSRISSSITPKQADHKIF